MMDELKPCPFCGNTEVEIINTEDQWEGDERTFTVICNYNHDPDAKKGCGATGQFSSNKKIAVKAWNQRTNG